ncbi:trypsin-like serine peptidase [Nonomuraea candida]|uniref:trypsin-like serine peptidase n=1 Tax=Nonomuraea candida TaxID=359159 RepID=UPI0012F7F7C0|nr:hypothetical protein [Nonomuraea candida]
MVLQPSVRKLKRTGKRSLALLGTLALTAALAAGPVKATTSNEPDPAGVAVKKSGQSAAQLSAYWTPARLKEAQPTRASDLGKDRKVSSLPASKLPAISAPGTRPAKVGLAPAPDDTRLNVVQAQRWNSHGVMPATTIGKLFYTNDQGANRYCSAAVINANNRNTIWTAGHCVHRENGGGDQGWFTNFLFRPDFDAGNSLGAWGWELAAAPQGWTVNGDWAYDIGAIALAPNASGNVQDITGSQGYHFNSGKYDYQVHAFGYPEDSAPVDRPEMDGQRLWYCTGATWKPASDSRMGFHCDMFHGASGGPVMYDLQLSRGWGYIVSANSWHYFANDEWRDPYLGDAAVNVYNSVKDH